MAEVGLLPLPFGKAPGSEDPMSLCVTANTERNQILQSIIPQLAPSPQVMNLQVACGPATLAPPSVSGQHLVAELFVEFGSKLQSGLFGTQSIHSISLGGESRVDPLEGLHQPESRRRSSRGNNHAICRYPTSGRLSRWLFLRPLADSCKS